MKKLRSRPGINTGEDISGLDPDEFSIFHIEFDKKNNVRLQYDEKALKELAESIRKEGQLQPVGIERKRNENEKHPLVYGYRRFIAVTDILGGEKIRVVFVDGKNRDVIQLTENIHRSDLSDLEIARSLVSIKEKMGYTNAELAASLNKSEDWIKDKIYHAKTVDSLLEESGSTEGVSAHPEVAALSTSHVRETRGLDNTSRKKVLKDAASKKKTAKDVRRSVNEIKSRNIQKNAGRLKSGISEKDRKKGEKLVLQLSTVRKTREILEDKLRKAREEEKRLLKELKNIGQPELFGV